MTMDNGMTKLSCDCPEITILKKENLKLKKYISRLETNGKGKPCPVCNSPMVSITSQDKRICDCGFHEPFRLKEGERSILIKNKIGGIE